MTAPHPRALAPRSCAAAPRSPRSRHLQTRFGTQKLCATKSLGTASQDVPMDWVAGVGQWNASLLLLACCKTLCYQLQLPRRSHPGDLRLRACRWRPRDPRKSVGRPPGCLRREPSALQPAPASRLRAAPPPQSSITAAPNGQGTRRRSLKIRPSSRILES